MNTSWQEMPFGEFATLQRGADLPVQARRPGVVPVLASNGLVGYHDTEHVQGPGVVTGRSGTIGNPTFVAGPYWPLNTVLWVSDFHGNEPHFVYYFFQAFDFKSLATGTSVPTLNRNSVHSIPVRVPPVAEQKSIALVLSIAQNAIAIEKKLIATTRLLKQATMRQLFSSGFGEEDQRETPYGDIPRSWILKPLSECATVQTGVTKGRPVAAQDAVDVPYLRVANVQDGHIDLREMKTIAIHRQDLPRYLLREGDVVLTEGGDFDKLGRGSIWRSLIPNCIHQNHVFAVRTKPDVLLPEFLAYLAQSPYGRSYFLTVAHKTTNLACINSTKLKALPVPLPSMEEQRRITDVLGLIDCKLLGHEKKHESLRILFETLLSQLMAGKMSTNGLNTTLFVFSPSSKREAPHE